MLPVSATITDLEEAWVPYLNPIIRLLSMLYTCHGRSSPSSPPITTRRKYGQTLLPVSVTITDLEAFSTRQSEGGLYQSIINVGQNYFRRGAYTLSYNMNKYTIWSRQRANEVLVCHDHRPGGGRGRFRVQGAGCSVQGSGFRVQCSGSRVQGSGFRVQSSVVSGQCSRSRE